MIEFLINVLLMQNKMDSIKLQLNKDPLLKGNSAKIFFSENFLNFDFVLG